MALRFFKAVLVEKTEQEVLDDVYPMGGVAIEERISNCPECDSDSWILLPDESVAVKEGGKQYCECMGCGLTTHL